MKVIAYYRVSTATQGRSGLGLEAQRTAVEEFCAARGYNLLGEFTEVESGSRSNRPQLSEAIHRATVTGATLVIAKLDRLSRNAAFLLTLRDAGVRFQAADMPDANNLTVGILALVAEQEREAISQRTKAALAAAKRRGVKLGNPNGAAAIRRAGRGNVAAIAAVRTRSQERVVRLERVVETLAGEGVQSLSGIAAALNRQEIEAPRGGRWHPTSVKRLLDRLNARKAPISC